MNSDSTTASAPPADPLQLTLFPDDSLGPCDCAWCRQQREQGSE